MLDTASVQKLHDAFAAVQRCIYDYEGTINKFLVDDKGRWVPSLLDQIQYIALLKFSHLALLSVFSVCPQLHMKMTRSEEYCRP